jgi:hypothetical protein
VTAVRQIFVTVITCTLLAVAAPGTTPAAQTGDRPCPKCQRIFDGRTWEGWEHDPQNWTIVDGAMRGFGSGARAAFTKADYGSFRLVVTSRMAPVNKDHLGILFWGPRPAEGSLAYSKNLQVQPPHGAMWDYFENKALEREVVTPGSRDFESWNVTEILANLKTGSVRVAVDGKEIVRYTDKDPGRLTRTNRHAEARSGRLRVSRHLPGGGSHGRHAVHGQVGSFARHGGHRRSSAKSGK